MKYLILFLSAFVSATLFPLNSELLFIALLQDESAVYWLWFVATLGNTLGAAVNWWLGKYMLHFQDRRWFPFKETSLTRASRWFNKFGKWSLLFAWFPIIGDALTFIAGTLRVNFIFFICLTALGKGTRYACIALLMLNI